MHDMTMPDLIMPGGWTLSMMWMPMGGQSWLDAALAFLGMWVPMMGAMMAPVVAPVLGRDRRALAGAAVGDANGLTACAAVGYFAVWSAVGLAIFPVGAALAAAALAFPALAQVVPVATAAIVMVAGALQLTAWKARRLSCCRVASRFRAPPPARVADAWRFGARVGLDCVACCSGLTAILLVVGVMDWRAMLAVTGAIALERLAPAGEQGARLVGGLAIGAGLALVFA